MFEERPESRMKGLKLIFKRKYESQKRNLLKDIHLRRKSNQEKQELLDEASNKLRAIKFLISRNKRNEELEKRNSYLISNELQVKINEDKRSRGSSSIYTEVVGKIDFPFIILKTKQGKENKIKV